MAPITSVRIECSLGLRFASLPTYFAARPQPSRGARFFDTQGHDGVENLSTWLPRCGETWSP